MNIIWMFSWIWAVSFTIVVIWICNNTNYIKKIWEEDSLFNKFNFEFIEFIIILISFIIAPFIILKLVIGEVRSFYQIQKLKFHLRKKVSGLKDKEVKRKMKEIINKIN